MHCQRKHRLMNSRAKIITEEWSLSWHKRFIPYTLCLVPRLGDNLTWINQISNWHQKYWDICTCTIENQTRAYTLVDFHSTVCSRNIALQLQLKKVRFFWRSILMKFDIQVRTLYMNSYQKPKKSPRMATLNYRHSANPGLSYHCAHYRTTIGLSFNWRRFHFWSRV